MLPVSDVPPKEWHRRSSRWIRTVKKLLDTDVCIAAIRGHTRVRQSLSQSRPGDCLVSTITVFELSVGVYKSRLPEREEASVQELLSVLWTVKFDRAAARCAAQIRAELERSGTPCGPYDTLLAGHALALGLPLITGNVREFSRVSGLRVENWLA